jgi:hypothetical protein
MDLMRQGGDIRARSTLFGRSGKGRRHGPWRPEIGKKNNQKTHFWRNRLKINMLHMKIAVFDPLNKGLSSSDPAAIAARLVPIASFSEPARASRAGSATLEA